MIFNEKIILERLCRAFFSDRKGSFEDDCKVSARSEKVSASKSLRRALCSGFGVFAPFRSLFHL
jgi:hypothetical protein